MEDEIKMHMPEGVASTEVVEKKSTTLFLVTIAILLILGIGAAGALFFLGDAVPYNPFLQEHSTVDETGLSATEHESETVGKDSEKDAQAIEENIPHEPDVVEAVVIRETLVGIPILVTDTETKKFIRLSVKDRGIVSVGVDENTKNIRDGGVLNLSAVRPGEELTIEGVRLSGGALYDYLAESVKFNVGNNYVNSGDVGSVGVNSERTKEERIEYMRTIGPMGAR